MDISGENADDLLGIEGVPKAHLSPQKVYDYYVTTIGGLEEVAERDLRYHLKGLSRIRIDREGRQGRLFFRYERSPQRLLEIRSVERVFALLGVVGGVTIGQPGLVRVAQRILDTDLAPAVALHDILHGRKDEARFALVCTVSGEHRFSSSEVHQIVQTILESKYEVYPEEQGAPYRLFLQILGRRAVFGLELSAPDRGERQAQAPRSFAYCMGLLAKVGARDVCCDPYPGDGSLMRGIAEACAPRSVHLGPEYPPDGSADRIVTMPAASDLAGREGEMLKLFERLLAPKRLAAVLVEDRQAMENALKRAPFETVQKTSVRLRGRPGTIVVLRRKG